MIRGKSVAGLLQHPNKTVFIENEYCIKHNKVNIIYIVKKLVMSLHLLNLKDEPHQTQEQRAT